MTVLVKGGHLHATGSGPTAVGSPDALVDATSVIDLPGERVATTSTHGTGCSLSAALAALRPQRPGWPEAARDAKEWLTGALRAGAALRVGSGRGPVDHLHALAPAGGARPQARVVVPSPVG